MTTMAVVEEIVPELEDVRSLESEEIRTTYTQAERDKYAKSGVAMADGSFPIPDGDALDAAIKTVGLGTNNSHNAIRQHIIARAKALGLSSKIPDNWAADGSISGANSEDDPEVETRDDVIEEPVLERRKPSLDHTIALRKAKMPKRGDLEHRSLPLEELEIAPYELREAAASDDADGRSLLRFSGYASVFDKRYSVGAYEETISAGAFKRSLSNPQLNCVLRVEHEGLPLARTTGKITLSDGSERPTLILREDEQGLHVDALLDAEDPDVQRLVPKFRRGDLSEMSFAFRANDDVWSDDYGLRTIRSAEIHRGDVAIVTYGASPTTTSTLRSEQAAATIHELGFGRFMEWYVEMRDYSLLPSEERAGAKISADSMTFLSAMLDLFATADSAVDEGQARLADFLGIENPNDPSDNEVPDDDPDAEVDDDTERSADPVLLPIPRDEEFLLELRMLGGGR